MNRLVFLENLVMERHSGSAQTGVFAWRIAALWLMLAATAWGQDPPASELQQQLDDLQRQIDQLQAAPRPMVEAPAAAPAAAEPPKYPKVQLTGFFQADAAWFSQGADNIEAVGDIQDGADFRRTRLAAVGDVAPNVGYIIEMDFSFPGRPSFMDVWGEVRDVAGVANVRMGQFRQPFGMDGLTSVRELPFLERALPFAFLPFRQIATMASGQALDETATWAVSCFRGPTDTYGGNIGDPGGYGVATRLTALLIDSEDVAIHLGGGYVLSDPSTNTLRYRNQPEVFVVEAGALGPILSLLPSDVPPFVDTGEILTRHANVFNAEFGAAWGSLYAQSEVFYSLVDRLDGSQLGFGGAYAQAAYCLTGERRAYNKKAGVFGRVIPTDPYLGRCGTGAWEVAARWSYIDLNDADVRGGRLGNLTLGVNWRLNQYSQMQFNYIHAMLYSNSEVSRTLVQDSTADIFAARFQIDF